MSKILHHVGRKEFKKTHQKKLDEQKNLAVKKLEEEKKIKQLEEVAKPLKSNWRRENLREFGEWAPIETSGPTNSTSTTFGYFVGGSPAVNYETGQRITFTYSGLNGIENYPTSITIDQGFGEVHTTNPPPFSQIGVQGYTAKLNPRYAEAKKKYDEEWKEWERKKEQQQKDIEATLKSFGTSFKDLRSSQYIKKVGNSYVGLIVTNPSRDFGSNLLNNVRVVRLVPCDPSKPMELQRNIIDADGKKSWKLSNAQYSDDVYLGIGEQPKAPMEQEYLMPRRLDYKDVNPLLDLGQEYAERVGADYMMGARVEPDLKPAPSFAEISPEDEQFIKNLSFTPHMVNLFSPGSGIAGTLALQYAKGDMTPMTRSPGADFDKGVLNMIDAGLTKGITRGSVTDRAYSGDTVKAMRQAPVRAAIGQFNYQINSSGLRILDRFNFNDNKSVGILKMIPGMQGIANRLVDIGNKRAINNGQNPTSDNYGIPIDYTIPWSKVPAQLQNKLDPTATIIPIVMRKKKKRQERG
jgi:hypothetical protein